METLKFEKDESGELEEIFEEIKDEEFPELNCCKINYIFRTTFKKDDEGGIVLGEAAKLPTRERDLYGYDFEICIHKGSWVRMKEEEKKRVAWHELNHLVVITDQFEEPKLDKARRIKIGIKPHDLVIRTFMEELEIFGPTQEQIKAINKIKKFKIKRELKRRK